MKRLVILFLISSFQLFAQTIQGSWKGEININGFSLPLVFKIDSTANGLSTKMDSPKQGAKDIPTNVTLFKNNELFIQIDALQFIYKGTRQSSDAIYGQVTQRGMTLPLNLQKMLKEDSVIPKIQEPSKPYPYYSEEVTILNKEHSLSGTLTLPKKEGKFPCVVLISGSGPQNRDEELLGHKPFLIIADYLTRKGFAVLRYDDRGFGKSTGNFATATTEDFAADANACLNYLKSRNDITSVGLIGHSEGGLIAPMVACNNKDVAFIVLLAGPGMKGMDLLRLQAKEIGKVNGMSDAQLSKSDSLNEQLYTLMVSNKDSVTIINEINKAYSSYNGKPATESEIASLYGQLSSPWFKYFLLSNPANYLEKVTCPVLAINGTLDLQVPAKENLAAIEKSLKLAGNKNYKIVSLKGLNHLFQKTKTGNPSEYATIEETFNQKALEEIGDWILEMYK
jgi:alpha/beta superfamily hydrolase